MEVKSKKVRPFLPPDMTLQPYTSKISISTFLFLVILLVTITTTYLYTPLYSEMPESLPFLLIMRDE